MLHRLSALWARFELGCAAILALCVTLLILLSVVTRSLGNAIYWVDELAIYTMIWMTFLGASAALHHRTSVAITVLSDAVPPTVTHMMAKFVDLVIFLFAIAMLWFCWRWFQPLEIIRAGFDTITFQSTMFNFVYAEPTSTLGLPKYLFWSVIWLFAFGATLHSAAHLISRRVER